MEDVPHGSNVRAPHALRLPRRGSVVGGGSCNPHQIYSIVCMAFKLFF